MKTPTKVKKNKYPSLPIDYQKINYTPEELRKKAVEYFEYCDKHKKPKTVSGLCIYCGIGNGFLNENKKSEQYSGVIEKINLILENYLEEQLLIGKNGNNVQFILSNRFRENWINQSKMKIENKGVHPGIKEALDEIIGNGSK